MTRFRVVSVALLALLVCAAEPAWADFPLTVRFGGGPGVGGVRENGVGTGGVGGLFGADFEFRPRPGRAWVASLAAGGVERGISLEGAGGPLFFGSATVGLERSRPDHASAAFTRAGVGLGQIGSGRNGSEILGSDGTGPREFGPALDAAVGYRLAPDPGPVGFVVEIRTHHVVAAHRSVHLLALALGLLIYPR